MKMIRKQKTRESLVNEYYVLNAAENIILLRCRKPDINDNHLHKIKPATTPFFAPAPMRASMKHQIKTIY